MEPFNNRIRILFKVDDQHRAFYWFQCSGDDIYWGQSGKAKESFTTYFCGKIAEIDLSKCDRTTFESAKSSYHVSGRFHIKMIDEAGNAKYSSAMNWREKKLIYEPFRIQALFTKAPIKYDLYERSPTRRGAKPLIFKFDDKLKHERQYVEFFITPEGNFTTPAPLIAVSEPVRDQPTTCPLSEKYILAVRRLSLPENHKLNDFQPDKEIRFFTEDSTIT